MIFVQVLQYSTCAKSKTGATLSFNNAFLRVENIYFYLEQLSLVSTHSHSRDGRRMIFKYIYISPSNILFASTTTKKFHLFVYCFDQCYYALCRHTTRQTLRLRKNKIYIIIIDRFFIYVFDENCL